MYCYLFIRSNRNKPCHVQITFWNIIKCLKHNNNLFLPRTEHVVHLLDLPKYIYIVIDLYKYIV